MIDLHTHSVWSDGSATPLELVELACATGISALALTDHDTVAGVPDFLAAAADTPVFALPGVEISASWYDGTMHILGLGVEPSSPALQLLLAKVQESRIQRNEQMLLKLQYQGMPLDGESLRELLAGSVAGRPHIAKALVAAGYCTTNQEAFNRFIGHGRSAYVRRHLPLPEEVIRGIHAAGGIAIWAHPTSQLRHSPAKLRQTARVLQKAGLDGLEAYYPEYTPREISLIREIAGAVGLMLSGGSDFHGEQSPGVALGHGRNHQLEVPDDLLRPLLERIGRERARAGLAPFGV